MKNSNSITAQMQRAWRANDYYCVAIDEIVRLLREQRFGRRKLKHLSSRAARWRNPDLARRTRAELLLLKDRCYVLLQRHDNNIMAAIRALGEDTWPNELRVHIADPMMFDKITNFVTTHVQAVAS